MPPQRKMQRRLRIAGVLAGMGLLVELGTLFGVHTSAFLIFVMIGVPLAIAGCVVFLYSVVSSAEE